MGENSQWARCRDWIVPALVEHSEDELVAELAAGRAQLWPGERSAMVTQLVNGPEPYILVWLGGGDLDELLQLRPGAEAWARSQGAKAARINGRHGWARALRTVGFEPDGGDLRKVL